MLEKLSKVFDIINDAVIIVQNHEIVYSNHAAKSFLPDGVENVYLEDIIPSQLLEHEADTFVGAAAINGNNINVSVSCIDDYRIFCFIPFEQEDEIEIDQYLFSVSLALNHSLSVWKMAYDLLTPHIENLEDEKLDQYMAILHRVYFSLMRIANNNRTISDILRDDGYLQLSEIDIVAMCREIIESLSVLLIDRGVNLQFESSVNSLLIVSDCEMIEQMILNLLSNSLKATEPGNKIILSILMAGQRIILQVTDTGKGIPSDLLLKVWNKGMLQKKTTDCNYSTGTGLSVVQHIARLHGGSAVLESHVGEGTKVTVMLPLVAKNRDHMNHCVTNIKTRNMTQILTELSDVLDYKFYSYKFMD